MASNQQTANHRLRSAGELVNEQSQAQPETEANPETEQPVCAECRGQLERDTEHGETACVDCGLVVDEDAVDRGPEWRAFDSAERDRKSRVGAPTTEMMHDKGLSTMISPRLGRL